MRRWFFKETGETTAARHERITGHIAATTLVFIRMLLVLWVMYLLAAIHPALRFLLSCFVQMAHLCRYRKHHCHKKAERQYGNKYPHCHKSIKLSVHCYYPANN